MVIQFNITMSPPFQCASAVSFPDGKKSGDPADLTVNVFM